jgi:hypothetical protein
MNYGEADKVLAIQSTYIAGNGKSIFTVLT